MSFEVVPERRTTIAAHQLGRMVAEALERKAPNAASSMVDTSRGSSEFMRLPPDARRVYATLLRDEFAEAFDIPVTRVEFTDLEIENATYRADEVFDVVESVTCTDPVLADLLASGSAVDPGRYARAADPVASFIAQEQKRGVDLLTDEHYLERRFLIETFLEAFQPTALDLLTSQVPFGERRARRIDFVLKGRTKYAIELEGHEYHDRDKIGRRRFNAEKQRQRDLHLDGYTYLPFSFDDVVSGSAIEALREVAQSDSQLRPLLRAENAQQQTDGPDPETLARYESAVFLFRELPALFHKVQYQLLDRLVYAAEAGGRIELTDRSRYGFAALAAADLWTLADRCCALYALDVRLPPITITTVATETQDRPAAALALYYGSAERVDSWPDSRLDAAPTGLVTQRLAVTSAGETPGAPDLIIRVVSDDGIEFDAIELQLGELNDLGKERTVTLLAGPPAYPLVEFDTHRGTIGFESAVPNKRLVDYFARRYFGIASLRRAQYETILRTLRGDSSFVLLATGGGKSLCYQLPALLLPGLTIVVSPLRALIRDQLAALDRLGVSAVAGTTSSDTPEERAELFRGLDSGKYRLLYLSPERLLIKNFVEELQRHITSWNVRLLAVDEAHCVSEWGHDFRPAYLAIPRFLQRVSDRSTTRPVPLLALTATASQPVQEDVIRTLGIPSDAVITYGSVDRPEISLSVHAARYDEGDGVRHELIADLVGQEIDRALGLEPGGLLARNQDRAIHASIVFGITVRL